MKVYSKVKAAGIAGAIVAVLIWVLGAFWGIELPPEVAAALVTIIAFIAGFFKTELHAR